MNGHVHQGAEEEEEEEERASYMHERLTWQDVTNSG